MRVGVRRLRALLRTGRRLLVTDTRGLEGRLRELGAVLGAVRDLDVLLEHLGDEASKLGEPDAAEAKALLTALSREREDKREVLLIVLRSDAYLKLLDDTAAAIDSLEPSDVGLSLDDVAAKAAKKLRKVVRALPDDPGDGELHAVRKTGKRARYAAELAGRTTVVRRAKALQDVLGEHQDAVVAAERIRELVARATPQQALAAGRLVAREDERRATARREWRETWERLQKKL
jgi:CHAD domain-containing protein